MTLPVPVPVPGVADPVSIEDVLVAWIDQGNIVLPGSCRAGEMPNDAVYPFVLITTTVEPFDGVTTYPSVDVDIFDPDYTRCATVAARIDKRIRGLKPRGLAQRPTVLVEVELDDGTTTTVPFAADRLQVVERPVFRDYADTTIRRFVGRYRIEHRCTAA